MVKLIAKTIAILFSVIVFIADIFGIGGEDSYLKQLKYNNGNIFMPQIVEAIKEKETQPIIDLMSKDMVDEIEDKDKEIKNMYLLISGEIKSISFRETGGGDEYIGTNSRRNDILTTQVFDFDIVTTDGNFIISLLWEQTNTKDPSQLGIRSISLFKDSIKTENRIYSISCKDMFHTQEIGVK